MLKRNVSASKKSVEPKGETASTSTVTSPTTQVLPPRENWKWFARKIFRILALLLFAYNVYPYFFGPYSWDKATLIEGGEYNIFASEPIVLDAVRRDAVLEAFKVRRMLSSSFGELMELT